MSQNHKVGDYITTATGTYGRVIAVDFIPAAVSDRGVDEHQYRVITPDGLLTVRRPA